MWFASILQIFFEAEGKGGVDGGWGGWPVDCRLTIFDVSIFDYRFVDF